MSLSRHTGASDYFMTGRRTVEVDGWLCTSPRLLWMVREYEPPRPYRAVDDWVERLQDMSVSVIVVAAGVLPLFLIAHLWWKFALLVFGTAAGAGLRSHIRAIRRSRFVRDAAARTLMLKSVEKRGNTLVALAHDGRELVIEGDYGLCRALPQMLSEGPAEVLALEVETDRYEMIAIRPVSAASPPDV